MKIGFFFILLFLISISSGFSQVNQQTESQKLTQQVNLLYQQGKLEEAVILAEKIVEIERKLPNPNLENLATATMNLANLEKTYDEILGKAIDNPNISEEESSKIALKRFKYSDSIPVLFAEVIKIYEEKLKNENSSLADAKFELALFLIKYQNRFPGTNLSEPERVEKLFLQSISLREKLLGADDDLTLSTVMTTADFYKNSGEFEKSLPLYQRFIQGIEKKYGGKSEFLLHGLRAYAKILNAIEIRDELKNVLEKISAVTGKIEQSAESDLDLTLRDKKDETAKLWEDPNTITSYLKKEKWLLVNVLIDEKGKIIEAKASDPQDKDIHGKNVKEKAEKEIVDWRFKPFIYKGTARKMRGVVWYPYFIKA